MIQYYCVWQTIANGMYLISGTGLKVYYYGAHIEIIHPDQEITLLFVSHNLFCCVIIFNKCFKLKYKLAFMEILYSTKCMRMNSL
jgi:hypothetical protein